jgi:hypothetical protein
LDADRPTEPLTSRSDLALARRARRERWGVPDDMKTAALELARRFLESDDLGKGRAALAFLACVDRIDQADERLQLERDKLERPDTPEDCRSVWDDVLDGSPRTDPPLPAGPGERSGPVPGGDPGPDALGEADRGL